MTACVKNHSKRVALAISASLVGALSLGAAAPAAFATGIDTQFVEPDGAFTNAKINAVTFVQGGVKKGPASTDKYGVYHLTYSRNQAVALNAVQGSMVGGASVHPDFTIDASDADDDYSVQYFTRDDNGDPADPVTGDIVDAGSYVAVITATDDSPYGGGTLYVRFDIDPVDISDIKVAGEVNSTYDAEPKDIVFYIDGDNDGAYDEGEELYLNTDYTVQWYVTGHDTSDAYKVDSVKDAGKYRAMITGKGNYTGSVNLNENVVTVDQLDLSKTWMADVYSTAKTEPSAPEYIVIDGALHGPGSAILDEIHGDIDSANSVDNVWGENGTYKYTVKPATANDPNFVSGQTGYFYAKKFSNDVSWTYNGQALASSYEIFLQGDTSSNFNDLLLAAKDSAGAPLSVNKATIIDANGKNVTTTSWWTNEGTYTCVYNATSADGGQIVLPVTVYNRAIDMDATAAVLYDADGAGSGKPVIVSSISAVYDGTDLLDKISTAVEDADGNPVSHKVSYYDADGNQVREIVNAGTYTLRVTAPGYKLSGTTEMTITVSPLDISGVRSAKVKTHKFDSTQNGTAYLPWTPSGYALGASSSYDDLTLQYEDADGNWQTLPMDVVKATVTKDGQEVKTIEGEGVYTIHFEARNADAANNYVVPGDLVLTCIKDGSEKDADEGWKVNHLKFSDVEYTDYFANAVDWVSVKGREYMRGYEGTDLFGADNKLTRAEVATVLYNMASKAGKVDESSLGYSETTGYRTGFSDVDGNMWYAKQIAWAKQAGVVNGDAGSDTFRPDDPVSREELAAMLANYASKFDQGYEEADASALDSMPDASQVSGWAVGSVAWAVENGIMGNGGSVMPTQDITRADTACMLQNYAMVVE